MKKIYSFIFSALTSITIMGIIFVLAACSDNVANLGHEQHNRTDLIISTDNNEMEYINHMIQANNAFALGLFQKMSKDSKDSNVVFSPYSIYIAFAMTYEGSVGQTAEEIRSVFGFLDRDIPRRKALLSLQQKIELDDQSYNLSIANALWMQENYQILNQFINIIENYYSGNAANVDFMSDPEKARDKINNWTQEHTEGLIKELFPRGSITPMTRLVLSNAIYFKGNWVTEFDPDMTRKQKFHVSQEQYVEVPMMSSIKQEFHYYESEQVQVLEMPYGGDRLSMLVMLPKDNNLSGLITALSPDKLNAWTQELQKEKVNVYLPKFEISYNQVLNEYLKSMGINQAFTPPNHNGADFSGITGSKTLFIDSVMHDALISVDETGTEAAAATGVSMSLTAMPEDPVPVFRADHPFIFFIQDSSTGHILFMGQVRDPN